MKSFTVTIAQKQYIGIAIQFDLQIILTMQISSINQFFFFFHWNKELQLVISRDT